MEDSELLHRLLHRALIEMRAEGHEQKNKVVHHLADLFHNVALQMWEVADGRRSHAEVMQVLREHSRRIGCERWVDERTTELRASIADSNARAWPSTSGLKHGGTGKIGRQQEAVTSRQGVLLSIQRALLGEVFPALRAVVVMQVSPELLITIYVDGDISSADKESVNEVEGEIAGDFEPDNEPRFVVVRIDAPQPLPKSGQWCAFARREP